MYQCKDRCLEMIHSFPYEFKYHRLVLSQRETKNKYLEGHCFFNFPLEEKWILWNDIKNYLLLPDSM